MIINRAGDFIFYYGCSDSFSSLSLFCSGHRLFDE